MKVVVLTYAKDGFAVDSINRLVEEATSRGHEVIRMRYTDCSMVLEGGEARLFYRGVVVSAVDVVIPWIIQGDFAYGLDVLRHFESMRDVFTLSSSEAIANACDKWRTAQLLAREHILTPNTYRALDYQRMFEHVDAMQEARQIVKILTGTRGNGVILSPDRTTTKSIVGTLGVLKDAHVVQEFVEESYGVDIRAYVVGDRVVASMERRSKGGFRSNLKLGGQGVPVRLTSDEVELAVRAAHTLGLGSAGIDIMRTKQGPVIIEANASGEFGIETVTGINVAAKIIEYIEQNAKRRPKKDKIGA